MSAALEECVAGEWEVVDVYDTVDEAEAARNDCRELLARVGLPPAEFRIRETKEKT